MGCSSSKAGGVMIDARMPKAGTPEDGDNKILEAQGLQPLNIGQLKTYNRWFSMIFEGAQEFGQKLMGGQQSLGLGDIMQKADPEFQEELFKKLDDDNDGKLTREQGMDFVKQLGNEKDPRFNAKMI